MKTQVLNNKLAFISIIVFILLSLSSIAFLYYQNQQLKKIVLSYQQTNQVEPTPLPTPEATIEPVACTMEAKLCPDGSSVGRTGPNCEFSPCPTP